MKARVFVVMPFGTQSVGPVCEGFPDVKVDFNRVYEELLKPAIAKADCEPFRADEEQSAGDIRTDMFFELVTADFVLADVSILNPNVFYELGARHGMTPRGTIMVSGSRTRIPFDIAPDRRFFYDGALFEVVDGVAAKPAPDKVRDEVVRLAGNLRRVIDSDREKVSSPVFAALPGLRPVDWSAIENAQARYFNVAIDETMRRVQTARSEGFAGDIMTLADNAPTRFHEGQLLLEAARALMDLRRFTLAREALDELLRLEPDNLHAKLRLALVLNRLDRGHEAELMLRDISALAPRDMDVLITLGRVYKDLWRCQWEDVGEPEQRRAAALRGYALASRATNYFSTAFYGNLNAHQCGIKALGMIALCNQLAQAGGEELTVVRESNVGLAEAVALGARAVLAKGPGRGMQPVDEVWAYATRGELAILNGDARRARHEYRKAVGLTDCTLFMIETMRSELRLYDLLGLHQDALAPVLADLDYQITQRQPKRYDKVVVFSGLRTDDPGRTPERFPERKAEAVGRKIRAQLEEWKIAGDRVLAISGGSRGGDILFAEQCRELGADLKFLVPLPEGEFIDRWVRGENDDWVERYFALTREQRCRLFFEHEQLGRLGSEEDRARFYDRTNRWRLNSARAEVDADDLYVLTVYDDGPSAGGGDATRGFRQQARRCASHYENINPRTVDG